MTPSFMSPRRRAGKMKTLILVSALAIIVAVGMFGASCGGTTATSATTAGTPTSAAGGARVVMKNLAFDPATVTIKVGQSVTWTNQESMTHTVVADNAEFKSNSLANAATFSFTFEKAGTYAYHCSIHPAMKGTVVVQ